MKNIIKPQSSDLQSISSLYYTTINHQIIDSSTKRATNLLHQTTPHHNTTHHTSKMSALDSHPRLLSLSANSSAASTPLTQSRRASHESTHDAHQLAHEEKTNSKLNLSIKKMWKGIKNHAVEHHHSVNAAYEATHGAGLMKL